MGVPLISFAIQDLVQYSLPALPMARTFSSGLLIGVSHPGARTNPPYFPAASMSL